MTNEQQLLVCGCLATLLRIHRWPRSRRQWTKDKGQRTKDKGQRTGATTAATGAAPTAATKHNDRAFGGRLGGMPSSFSVVSRWMSFVYYSVMVLTIPPMATLALCRQPEPSSSSAPLTQHEGTNQPTIQTIHNNQPHWTVWTSPFCECRCRRRY